MTRDHDSAVAGVNGEGGERVGAMGGAGFGTLPATGSGACEPPPPHAVKNATVTNISGRKITTIPALRGTPTLYRRKNRLGG